MEKFTQEQIEAAAKSLGFENADLMLEYFKQRQLESGIYEALRGESK